ncbi:hypothetical protein RHMOL_Rhmol02G0088800 [Rhododendron molle]|uniref:Uncharacterized protein n=1 Tax=Rhododendron molle TaxID=49168 RepID=A0ACC0PMR8_RHOML|nr:hypothetical protein RHMOL_Rhmol02G0088800 [Rhododendron molle]
MGNMVGFAFDKVKEGLRWLVSLVSQGIDSCFRKLKESITWAISKVKNLVTSLIENLRDLLGHNKEFINMVCEAEKITGQWLKLVPFGHDEQKNPLEIGNILSDLQKSCLPFLAALSKLEEFEKLGFTLPEEFEEEKMEGFFPNKFESLDGENEGIGASAFSKPEEFGEEKLGFALPEEFDEEEIDGFFPIKFESLADENEGKGA